MTGLIPLSNMVNVIIIDEEVEVVRPPAKEPPCPTIPVSVPRQMVPPQPAIPTDQIPASVSFAQTDPGTTSRASQEIQSGPLNPHNTALTTAASEQLSSATPRISTCNLFSVLALRRPIKLVLVDSRPFCKTRKRRRVDHSGEGERSLQDHALVNCTCCPPHHHASEAASSASRDCESCDGRSDEDYDDAVTHRPRKRRSRKTSKEATLKPTTSGSGVLEKSAASAKGQGGLLRADWEVIRGSALPTKPSVGRRRQQALKLVSQALDGLDWHAAATELAGIQVHCQRKVMTLKGNGDRAGPEIQSAVASLKTYWTGVWKQSINSIR